MANPCPKTLYSIGTVKVDEFTGAISYSKEISFDKLEMKPEDDNGFVCGTKLGPQNIKIKLINPRGFCIDEDV